MEGIELLIMKGIGLLILKGIGLLVMKGIGLLIRKGIRILGVKYCFSQTMSRTLSKFSLPFDEATTLVHFPKALNCRGITRVLLSMVFKHGLLEVSTSEQMRTTVFPRG